LGKHFDEALIGSRSSPALLLTFPTST
jgi:hypothetical protein